MKKLLIFSIFFIALKCQGQSLFEDANGESSLQISDNYGWARFNSSSSSVSIGYNRTRRSGYDYPNIKSKLILGGDLKASIREGVGTILAEKKLTPGIETQLNFGLISKDLLDQNNSIISVYFRGGFEFQKLNTLDSISLIEIENKEYLPKISLNLNFLINEKDSLHHFFGLSFGKQILTNYNDLKKVKLVKTIKEMNEVVVISEVESRLGYLNSGLAYFLNFDYGITPKILKSKKIGFNFYYRGVFGKIARFSNTGVGLFFPKKDYPDIVLGGIALQFNDIFNQKESDQTFFERSSVFFFVGYNIK